MHIVTDGCWVLRLDAGCDLMQSSAGMPILVQLQLPQPSICVCQNLVDNVAADSTDEFACICLETFACSAEHC